MVCQASIEKNFLLVSVMLDSLSEGEVVLIIR